MRQYELALVLKSDLSETNRKKLLDTFKEILKGLKVVKEDAIGQKALAYPVKKETTAYFHILQLEGENVPSDFEKKVREQGQVLRHLLIRRK